MGENAFSLFTFLWLLARLRNIFMFLSYLLVLFYDLPVHIFYLVSILIVWLLSIESCSLDINLCYMCGKFFNRVLLAFKFFLWGLFEYGYFKCWYIQIYQLFLLWLLYFEPYIRRPFYTNIRNIVLYFPVIF